MTSPPPDIEMLLRSIATASGDEGAPEPSQSQPSVEVQARRLLDHYADLSKTHTFEPGQLVQLKPGLNGHVNLPVEGQPCIVTKIYETPLKDETVSNAHPDFGRKFDIALLLLTRDGRAVEFAYDGRVFEPYTGEIA